MSDDLVTIPKHEVTLPAIHPTLIESFKKDGAEQLADAKLFSVQIQAEYNLAMEFRRQLKIEIERAKSFADPICAGLHKAHGNMCDLRNEMIGGFVAADEVLDKVMKAYVKKTREAQALLAAQQLAETKRLDDEARAELAKELELAGEPEQAQEVLSAPMEYHVPTTPSLVPKGVRQLWKVTRVDVAQLAKFVGEHPMFAHFLEAVEAKLRTYKIDNPKAVVPGVEFEQDDSIPVKK